MREPHLQIARRPWVPPRRPGARLAVSLLEEKVGALGRRGPGRYRFAYSSERSIVSALSVSLPPKEGWFTPAQTAPFFEGLLPEGSARGEVAKRFGLSDEDGFGLLAAIGAECAGAVTIAPEEEEGAASAQLRPLSQEELEAMVAELPNHPLGVSPEPGGMRLSLGGVQSKLVLARTAPGEYAVPLGGAPSTCLIKPDFGHYEDLASNEHFCMRVAAAVGLEAAETELTRIGSVPCLHVERFDRRRRPDGGVTRIHQEDMCQALGVRPSAKYEGGGPSAASIVSLFRGLGSARAARDINAFLKAFLVNFLLGNGDAHGKNFALLYDPDAGVQLAPLYDVLSTAVYGDLTDRMAMTIGGIDDPDRVDIAAWRRLAGESGVGGQLSGFILRWSTEVLSAVESVRDAAQGEGWHRPVIDAIVDVCRKRAARLAA